MCSVRCGDRDPAATGTAVGPAETAIGVQSPPGLRRAPHGQEPSASGPQWPGLRPLGWLRTRTVLGPDGCLSATQTLLPAISVFMDFTAHGPPAEGSRGQYRPSSPTGPGPRPRASSQGHSEAPGQGHQHPSPNQSRILCPHQLHSRVAVPHMGDQGSKTVTTSCNTE